MISKDCVQNRLKLFIQSLRDYFVMEKKND